MLNQENNIAEKDFRWKGVLFINLYTLSISLGLLCSQILYKRKIDLIQPEQLLFIRSVFACLAIIIFVNKNLYNSMYSGIPKGNRFNLFCRTVQSIL